MRTFVNKPGVSYDAAKTTVIFAEDMNEIVGNIEDLQSKSSIITLTDSGDHITFNPATPATSAVYYVIINNAIYTADNSDFPYSLISGNIVFDSALPSDLLSSVIKLVCL